MPSILVRRVCGKHGRVFPDQSAFERRDVTDLAGVNINVGIAMIFDVFKIFCVGLQYIFQYFEGFQYLWPARIAATVVRLGIVVKRRHIVEGVDELV